MVTQYPSCVCLTMCWNVLSSFPASFVTCHICQQSQKQCLFRNETSHCKSAFCKTAVFCVHGLQQPSRYKSDKTVLPNLFYCLLSILFMSLFSVFFFFFKDCLRRANCRLRWVLLGSESLTPTDQSKLRKRQQGHALHWSKQPSVNQSELWSLPKVHKQWYQTELFLDFPGNSILCA